MRRQLEPSTCCLSDIHATFGRSILYTRYSERTCLRQAFWSMRDMSAVQQIEEAVRRPSIEERATFRAWFAEFDAEEWDRQFEADVEAGRLDWIIDEAKQDLREGRCTDRWTIERLLASGHATAGYRRPERHSICRLHDPTLGGKEWRRSEFSHISSASRAYQTPGRGRRKSGWGPIPVRGRARPPGFPGPS